jgi:hypothetical protein
MFRLPTCRIVCCVIHVKKIAQSFKSLWAFLGIFMIFSIMQVPKYSISWGSSTFFGIPGLGEIMSRERFERLCNFFYVNDTTNNPARRQPEHDKLCQRFSLHVSFRTSSSWDFSFSLVSGVQTRLTLMSDPISNIGSSPSSMSLCENPSSRYNFRTEQRIKSMN